MAVERVYAAMVVTKCVSLSDGRDESYIRKKLGRGIMGEAFEKAAK